MTDTEALNAAFGTLAVHTGFFPVMIAFGLVVALVVGIRNGGW